MDQPVKANMPSAGIPDVLIVILGLLLAKWVLLDECSGSKKAKRIRKRQKYYDSENDEWYVEVPTDSDSDNKSTAADEDLTGEGLSGESATEEDCKMSPVRIKFQISVGQKSEKDSPYSDVSFAYNGRIKLNKDTMPGNKSNFKTVLTDMAEALHEAIPKMSKSKKSSVTDALKTMCKTSNEDTADFSASSSKKSDDESEKSKSSSDQGGGVEGFLKNFSKILEGASANSKNSNHKKSNKDAETDLPHDEDPHRSDEKNTVDENSNTVTEDSGEASKNENVQEAKQNTDISNDILKQTQALMGNMIPDTKDMFGSIAKNFENQMNMMASENMEGVDDDIEKMMSSVREKQMESQSTAVNAQNRLSSETGMDNIFNQMFLLKNSVQDTLVQNQKSEEGKKLIGMAFGMFDNLSANMTRLDETSDTELESLAPCIVDDVSTNASTNSNAEKAETVFELERDDSVAIGEVGRDDSVAMGEVGRDDSVAMGEVGRDGISWDRMTPPNID